MKNFVSIKNLKKNHKNNFKALDNLSLNIEKGEIFALLGPNGAGKSTLINIICGIVKNNSGKILVNNFDIIKDYRKTRSMIGVVPQELPLEAFEHSFDGEQKKIVLVVSPPWNRERTHVATKGNFARECFKTRLVKLASASAFPFASRSF